MNIQFLRWTECGCVAVTIPFVIFDPDTVILCVQISIEEKMLQNWASYLLGTASNNQKEQEETTVVGVSESSSSSSTTQQPPPPPPTSSSPSQSSLGNTRLTEVFDDDWILVDKEDNSSEESFDVRPTQDGDGLSLRVSSARMVRTGSATSLPCATTMEESWFLTPPPCFISTGPVHMETSPLENLLIEHPSMSVYQHHNHFHRRRGTPSLRSASAEPNDFDDIALEDVETEEETASTIFHALFTYAPRSQCESSRSSNRQIVRPTRRSSVGTDEEEEGRDLEDDAEIYLDVVRSYRAEVERYHLEERQYLKKKQAQKVQTRKSAKSLKKGYLDRNCKAREVNCRNQRQRRGERSQGAYRSNANNNRKC